MDSNIVRTDLLRRTSLSSVLIDTRETAFFAVVAEYGLRSTLHLSVVSHFKPQPVRRPEPEANTSHADSVRFYFKPRRCVEHSFSRYFTLCCSQHRRRLITSS
ncbi:unnamed protein product [Ascophyllum nodosum]